MTDMSVALEELYTRVKGKSSLDFIQDVLPANGNIAKFYQAWLDGKPFDLQGVVTRPEQNDDGKLTRIELSATTESFGLASFPASFCFEEIPDSGLVSHFTLTLVKNNLDLADVSWLSLQDVELNFTVKERPGPVRGSFSGRIGQLSDLKLSVDIPVLQDRWRLHGTFTKPKSISDVMFLAAGEGLVKHLPEFLQDVASSLQVTELSASYDANLNSLAYVELTIQTPSSFKWTPVANVTVTGVVASALISRDGSVSYDVTGKFLIGKPPNQAEVFIEALGPDFEIVGGLSGETPLRLTALVENYLGDAKGLPEFDISAFAFRASLAPQRLVQIRARVQDHWKLPLDASGDTYMTLSELGVDIFLSSQEISASLEAVFQMGQLEARLFGSVGTGAEAFSIGAELSDVNLSELLNSVGIARPAMLEDVEFTKLVMRVAPVSGEFSFDAQSTKSWHIPVIGGSLTVRQLDVSVARKSIGGTDAKGFDCNITVSVGDLIVIPDQLVLEAFTLIFTSTSGEAWTASAAVKGKLMDLGIELSASYAEINSASTLTLKSSITSKRDLVSLGPLGSLHVDCFSLGVVTEQAQGDQPSKRCWTVTSHGGVQLGFAGVDYLSTGGLEFYEDEQLISLGFLPDKARAEVPLDPFPGQRPPPMMLLDFKKISVIRSAGPGKSGWAFKADVDYAFRGLPKGLQDYLVDLQPFKTHFSAGDGAVTLTAETVMKAVCFDLPTIARGDLDLSLGTAAIFVSNLSVSLGSEISLSAEVNIGLPSELNHVFGVRDDGAAILDVFNVFDPEHPQQNLFELRLGVGTQGISFQVLTSPFSFLKVVDKVADEHHVSWDGDFGSLGFKLPTLQLKPETQSFEVDVGLDVSDLKIPLTPLKSVLSALGLDEIAAMLQDSLPFESMDLFDDHDQLRVSMFIDLLKKLGIPLTDKEADILRGLARPIDHLPAGLKTYFRIAMPESFNLHIAVTAAGSVQFDFAVGEDSEPLRFLFPVVSALPELVGVELRGISVGELFGGALLVTRVDARIDRFDLPMIVGSVLLPDGGISAIPAFSRTLQKRIIVDKLFMIIVYEAVVPIPIPLFYDKLGFEYWGIEGLQFGGGISLKMPHFNFVEVIKQVGLFKDFFTDKTVFLHPDEPPQDMDIAPSTGPNYIQLPAYLGSGMLGDRELVHQVSAYGLAAGFLNRLKQLLLEAGKLTINDLIQVVPLDDRVKAGEVTVAGITAGGAYAITTPQEFTSRVYQRLNLNSITPADARAVLPRGESKVKVETDETGICLFFGGGFDVKGAVTFEAVYALAAANSRFGTGFGIHGSLAGGSFDLALKGLFIVDLNPLQIRIEGRGHLTVFDQQILAGEVTLGDSSFHLQGMADFFPKGSVRLTLDIAGDLDEHDCRFEGGAALTVGPNFTLVGGSFILDTTQFVITGTWLDQTVRFAIVRFERGQVAGLRFSAELYALGIGDLFRLTGDGPNGGPCASLERFENLSFTLTLSGEVYLLGVRASTTVHVTDLGFEFQLSGDLLGIFACQLTVVAANLAAAGQFQLTAKFQGESIEAIENQALNLLTDIGKETSTQLGQAQKVVDDAKVQLQAAVQMASQQVDEARDAVQKIQRQIDAIDNKLKKLSYIKDAIEIARLKLQRSSLVMQLVPANTNLALAKALYEFATVGKAIVGVLTPALNKIKADIDTAREQVAAAGQKLSDLEKQLGSTKTKLARYTGTFLTIERIEFTETLNSVTGAGVRLKVWSTFLGETTDGEPHEVLCQLQSPEGVARALVGYLL